MKALVWTDETGQEIQEIDIPEDRTGTGPRVPRRAVETVAEHDDAVMHKYLEGIEPDEKEIRDVIRKITATPTVFPVLCGSALRNKGVQPVLDAIVDYLPSPRDIKPVEGHDPKNTEEIITREASDKEPFCGLVFKLMSDPYVGKLSYLRVYSGHLKTGDQV